MSLPAAMLSPWIPPTHSTVPVAHSSAWPAGTRSGPRWSSDLPNTKKAARRAPETASQIRILHERAARGG